MNTNYDQLLETVSTGPDSASVRIQGTDTIICQRITDHFAAEVVSRWKAAPELLEALELFLSCKITNDQQNEAARIARAAIAKATND